MSARPRCSVFIATSLDGFIARADGGLDWLALVEAPGEDYGYGAFVSSVDALVMGHNTYATALAFDAWPYGGKRVIVLSRDATPSRHGEEHTAEAPVALCARLAAEGVEHVYVDGGATIRRFLDAGLIDDLTISLVPIVLGTGIPLFGGIGEHRLTLIETRGFPSGLVQVRYRTRAA
ncbi:MAG: dihydrofolate reductase family protein [Deltaproteobacteria bacterium]|nr:dihydrofolate reductase family protein [Deltaproteobacteria bacterium]